MSPISIEEVNIFAKSDLLLNAVISNDINELKNLLNEIDIDVCGDAAFITAIQENNLEIIALFLKNKKDITCEKNPILRLTLTSGDMSMTEFLLNNGVIMKESDELAIVCYNNDLKRVKLFVTHGVNLFAENNIALITACENDSFEVIKYLVEQGADFTIKNNYPLLITANKGNLNTIKYFVIECNVNPDIIINNILTEKEVMRWVLSYKNSIDLKEKMENDLPIKLTSSNKVKL